MSGICQAASQGDVQPLAFLGAWGVSITAMRGTGLPLVEIEALYDDSVATDFDRCDPNPAKSRTCRPKPCLGPKDRRLHLNANVFPFSLMSKRIKSN